MTKHIHVFQKLFNLKTLALITLSATYSLASHAICTDDSHVFVKKVCDGTEPGFCTSDIKLLDDWIWNLNSPTDYRCTAPTETDPVLVDIGPGHFTGSVLAGKGLFYCPFFDPKLPPAAQDPNGPRNGYVRIRGAGPEFTILEAQGAVSASMVFGFCTDIVVEDISLVNNTTNAYGIYWYGGGVSRWTNVKSTGYLAGWYDGATGACADEKGVHYWYDSIIESPKVTYKSECDENWIYASDLVLKPINSATASGGIVVSSFGEGDVRIFGSSVRLDTSLLGPAVEVNMHGVRAGYDSFNSVIEGNGVFHMHGGIISLNAPQATKSTITAVEVTRGEAGTAVAHIVETAFAMNVIPGNMGTVTRVKASPESAIPDALRSPFQWPASNTPPLDDKLVSITGYDQYVEYDCQNDGQCDATPPGKTSPHLMIYDLSCSSRWFNTVTRRCRNVVGHSIRN